MTRPSKFDLMRANRKAAPKTERDALQRRIDLMRAYSHWSSEPVRDALVKKIDQMEAEMDAEWHADVQELREVDIDAIHEKRKESATPRWWHGLKFNRRTT